jgi:hypothetical protein
MLQFAGKDSINLERGGLVEAVYYESDVIQCW